MVMDAMPARKSSKNSFGIRVGDLVKIERRYILDGAITSVMDQGRYQGVQSTGTMEHLVLEDKKEVRLIPLASVSEITLVRAAPVRAEPIPHDPNYQ